LSITNTASELGRITQPIALSLKARLLVTAASPLFNGNPDFSASGGYVFGSWVLTGESRPYGGGNVGNIKPKGKWGAWELLLRYSELDLNDRPVQGGKEHDWTIGANWYLGNHLKFQANYIRAYSNKLNTSLNQYLEIDPEVLELRAQIYF